MSAHCSTVWHKCSVAEEAKVEFNGSYGFALKLAESYRTYALLLIFIAFGHQLHLLQAD